MQGMKTVHQKDNNMGRSFAAFIFLVPYRGWPDLAEYHLNSLRLIFFWRIVRLRQNNGTHTFTFGAAC